MTTIAKEWRRESGQEIEKDRKLGGGLREENPRATNDLDGTG